MEEKNKARFMDISGSSELHPNSSSMKSESKIQDISNSTNSGGIINTTLENCSSQGNNNDNTNINIKDEIGEESDFQSSVEIQIKRDNNSLCFLIRAFGHNIHFYQENKNTKIKNVIEKYFQKEKLNDDIKYKFYCNDNPIENLENTISELNLKTLDIINILKVQSN